MPGARERAESRVELWKQGKARWEAEAKGVSGQSAMFAATRHAVAEEEKVVADHVPERSFVRPLLVVVPRPAV